MTILHKLATALNRRDEVPNQELAHEIVRKGDKTAVKELVENLSNKGTNIQNDCIKVLYEIGAAKPELIATYYKEFAKLLDSKNNRMVWGAMTALDAMALNEPKAVFGMLSKILATADAGSVITRDHAFGILAKLGTLKQYSESCFPLLVEQLMSCPNNQFPMYAEKSLAIATDQNKDRLKKVLNARIENLEKESQKKRIL